MKKIVTILLALVLALGLCSVSWAADGKVVVHGIKYNNKDDNEFATFEEAYAALKPVVASVCDTDALGQGVAKSVEEFKSVFTDVDQNNTAKITYTIYGNVTYDENQCTNLLSMGRKSSHYTTENSHLGSFEIKGGDTSASLTLASGVTFPYEWWEGEEYCSKVVIKDLLLKGDGTQEYLSVGQSNFQKLDLTITGCTFDGIYLYEYNQSADADYTISGNIFKGNGTIDYPILIQCGADQGKTREMVISNNQISGSMRGINVEDTSNAASVVISGNTIKDLVGKTENGKTYGSAIQLTNGKSFIVENNTISNVPANALHIHRNCKADTTTVAINNNNISAGYLIWNEANVPVGNITSANNVISDATNTSGGINKVGEVVPNGVTINVKKDSPKFYYNSTTTDTTKGSPKTFDAGVGVYAVTAVLSVTGMAWTAKKRH